MPPNWSVLPLINTFWPILLPTFSSVDLTFFLSVTTNVCFPAQFHVPCSPTCSNKIWVMFENVKQSKNNNKNLSFSWYLGNKIGIAILFWLVTCSWKSTRLQFPRNLLFSLLVENDKLKRNASAVACLFALFRQHDDDILGVKLLPCWQGNKQLS